MKDIIIRAIKTFIQAIIAYACTLSFIDVDWGNKTVVMGIVLSGIAAGVSALMNFDWTALNTTKEEEEE